MIGYSKIESTGASAVGKPKYRGKAGGGLAPVFNQSFEMLSKLYIDSSMGLYT